MERSNVPTGKQRLRARQRFTGACRPISRNLSSVRRKAIAECGEQFIPETNPLRDACFSARLRNPFCFPP